MHDRGWIQVFHPEVNGCHLIYHYRVCERLKKYFRTRDGLAIDWPFDVSDIPESILLLPLLAQLLPVAWVTDAEIAVPSCNLDFYEALDAIREGYRKMYPMIPFRGGLKAEKLERNVKPSGCAGKSIVCFSGGVDAMDTVLAHLEEHPLLVSVWGSDVFWSEIEEWRDLEAILRQDAEKLGLEQLTVRSAFRKLLSESQLSKAVADSGDDWWHGFQHGLGILGHMAPVAWKAGAEKVYIASSFTAADRYTCASDPSIDNRVRFCGTQVVHDGCEKDRQQKIRGILDFCRREGVRFPLHVCWEKRGAVNCCRCEKCWRTMLALVAESADPREYGFPDYTGVEALKKTLSETPAFFGKNPASRYGPIQRRLRNRAEAGECPEELRWFCDLDLAALASQSGVKQKTPAQPAASSRVQGGLLSWAFRRRLVKGFWAAYGKLHHGWRRAYASFITEYTESEWSWNRDCQTLHQTLLNDHPGICRFGGLHRQRWKYYFCRVFLGAIPSANYFGCQMFRHGWIYNRTVLSNGKLRFAAAKLNSREAFWLCDNKIASAERWNAWYRRGWLAAGPGHPVTAGQLKHLLNGKQRLVRKPLDDYGGHGVEIRELRTDAEAEALVDELNRSDVPVILEEFVEQKGLLHEINPSSMNTVRVVTIRHRDGTIEIINAYLRLGGAGSVVDNITSGGSQFYIDPASGRIGMGDDFRGRTYTAHPDTKREVTGLTLPRFGEVTALCRELHRHAPEGLRLAGWDICISEDGLMLIEVNCTPGTLNSPNGRPDLWKTMRSLLDEYEEAPADAEG